MKTKTRLKIGIDIAMTVALLLLMTYSLISEALHEWIGVGMLVLFILHHILNGRWSRSVLKGRYNIVRVLRVLAVIIACYGAYAFVKRDVASYMFLRNPFVFFDYGEPVIFFILDYLTIMGLFVFIGHYLTAFLKKTSLQSSKKSGMDLA